MTLKVLNCGVHEWCENSSTMGLNVVVVFVVELWMQENNQYSLIECIGFIPLTETNGKAEKSSKCLLLHNMQLLNDDRCSVSVERSYRHKK